MLVTSQVLSILYYAYPNLTALEKNGQVITLQKSSFSNLRLQTKNSMWMGECQHSKVTARTLGKICCSFPHNESEINSASIEGLQWGFQEHLHTWKKVRKTVRIWLFQNSPWKSPDKKLDRYSPGWY